MQILNSAFNLAINGSQVEHMPQKCKVENRFAKAPRHFKCKADECQVFLRGLVKLIPNAPVSAGPRAHPGIIAQIATGVKR